MHAAWGYAGNNSAHTLIASGNNLGCTPLIASLNNAEYNSRTVGLIMEVVLAAITLATAIKDIVELGQKIYESFAKVSRNLRNSQRVAKDIQEMVMKIKIFYDSHKDALDNMEDFRVALLDLLDKFRSFERSILPLLPKMGKRVLGLFVRGWWNNNRIEGHILDLQRDIMQVLLNYTFDSVMRIEVAQEINYQATHRGLTSITQGLEVVLRDVSAIAAATIPHPYESSGPGMTNDTFTRNIIMFAQSTASTSVPMLRSPDVITEELATTVYIKVQINSIATIVEKLSTMPVSAQSSVTKLLLSPTAQEESMSIMNLRHHIVREVTSIRDALEVGHLQSISTEHITALNNLSVALGILNMPQDAFLVRSWTLTLSRVLLDASSGKHPDLNARLAFYLHNQSTEYAKSGNTTQSLQAAMDAYAITQDLHAQHGEQISFRILHSQVLLQYARLVNGQQSIKMCIDAIHVLEDILNIITFTTKPGHIIEGVVEPSSSFLDCLFSPASPKSAIVQYAHSLQHLGTCSCINGDPDSALALWLLAIAVHRRLLSIYGDRWKAQIAMALFSLLQDKTAEHLHASDCLSMAEECIQLFRELASNNPPYYARRLVKALWVQAAKLQDLGRASEAIVVWEEVATLARQILQDSLLCGRALEYLTTQFRYLKRHSDAVRTAQLAMTTYREDDESQASQYLSLSSDLQKLRRYKESAEAARKAVMLCQRLSLRNLQEWMYYLPAFLSNLAHCLSALGDYSEALIVWAESVSIMDNFLKDTHKSTISDAIHKFCMALTRHQKINLVLRNEDQCLDVCSTTVQYLCRLLKISPQHGDVTESLFSAAFSYAYNMLRFGRLQDAHQYIDSWLDRCSGGPETTPNSITAEQLAMMTNLKVIVCDAQGYTSQALLITQNVHGLVKKFVNISRPCLLEMIESMHREAQLRGSLGESAEALAVAERALQLARDSTLKPLTDGLVWSLHAVAFSALLYKDYNRALEAAQEGCKILNSPQGSIFGEDSELYSVIRPSLFALLSSAEANLGRYSSAVEYAHRAVEESLEIGENKLYISSSAAEHCYMETRGNLAEVLLATSDLSHAREICEERKFYLSKRVETRMGDYRELVPTLRMLGILCCSEGRHEEGDTAAQELARVVKMLGGAFPSLQEQVIRRLRHQANIPMLKIVDTMNEKLECGHQTEVDFLLGI